MRWTLRLVRVTCCFVLAGLLSASTPSPKEVVQTFVKMDVDGTRLTPEGWRTAEALFTRMSQPAKTAFVIVIARDYAVREVTQDDGPLHFVMGYEEVGRINTSSLQFTPTGGEPSRNFDSFTLVRTSSPEQWKIEGVQPTAMHLSASAAIRFVAAQRELTSDPVIRKHADQALIKLKGYR